MGSNDAGVERLHAVIWAGPGPPAVACAPATVKDVSC